MFLRCRKAALLQPAMTARLRLAAPRDSAWVAAYPRCSGLYRHWLEREGTVD
ncbi:hypothetical protein PST29_4557 [Pseudomonas sp. St29]|nr:hypothetical protein PST29_4557 [Pseudomonas sp. St29]